MKMSNDGGCGELDLTGYRLSESEKGFSELCDKDGIGTEFFLCNSCRVFVRVGYFMNDETTCFVLCKTCDRGMTF